MKKEDLLPPTTRQHQLLVAACRRAPEGSDLQSYLYRTAGRWDIRGWGEMSRASVRALIARAR